MGLVYNICCPRLFWVNESGALQPNTNSCDFNFLHSKFIFHLFFRVNKWNISGPIFKLKAKQELGWWRKVFKSENYFQTGETEPSEDGPNRTIKANLVDCLSCGHPVPVRSETCIQCGLPYLISTNSSRE